MVLLYILDVPVDYSGYIFCLTLNACVNCTEHSVIRYMNAQKAHIMCIWGFPFVKYRSDTVQLHSSV